MLLILFCFVGRGMGGGGILYASFWEFLAFIARGVGGLFGAGLFLHLGLLEHVFGTGSV